MIPDRGDHPTGQRGRHQARIEPRRRGIGDGWLCHRPQTRTSGRSFSSRPGPMPSTSPSWSTLVNLPLASRHATIAAALTGPTPGRVSNCCTVAVFRLITAAGCGLGRTGRGAGRAGSGRAGAHRTAQHRRLAFDRRDPHDDLLAVVDLAGHVEPDGVRAVRRAAGGLQRVGDPRAGRQRDQPGRVHQAHHADHYRLVGPGWTGGLGLRLADDAMSTGGSFADTTGAGCSRISVKMVTSTAIAAIAANAIAPARPGSARTLASQPPSCCAEPSGSHRGSKEFGSVSASGSSAVAVRIARPRPAGRRVVGAVARRAVLFACADRRSADCRSDAVAAARPRRLWTNRRLCTNYPACEPSDWLVGQTDNVQCRTVRSSRGDCHATGAHDRTKPPSATSYARSTRRRSRPISASGPARAKDSTATTSPPATRSSTSTGSRYPAGRSNGAARTGRRPSTRSGWTRCSWPACRSR